MSERSPWDDDEPATDAWSAPEPVPSAQTPTAPADDPWGLPGTPVSTQPASAPVDDPWGVPTGSPVQMPEGDPWGSPEPARSDWDELLSPASTVEDERPEPRERRKAPSRDIPWGRIGVIVGGIAVVGAVVVFAGPMVMGMLASTPEASATPTPTPTEYVAPVQPYSTLSTNVRTDLSFDANVPVREGISLKNVSVAIDAIPAFVRGADEGFTSYVDAALGCSVNWSSKDGSYAEGVTDFEASLEELEAASGSTDFDVAQYGYWTESSVPIAGSTEMVETRVEQDDEAVILAARALTATGESGLIWMVCDNPDDLDGFAADNRNNAGFILSGLGLE